MSKITAPTPAPTPIPLGGIPSPSSSALAEIIKGKHEQLDGKPPATVVAPPVVAPPVVNPPVVAPTVVAPVEQLEEDLGLSSIAKSLLTLEKPKETPKPEDEKDDFTENVLPKDASRKAQETFSKLRSERNEFKQKYEELQAKIEAGDLPNNINEEFSRTKTELTETKAKYDEAQKHLFITDVQKTEVYKTHVEAPLTKVVAELSQIATANNLSEKSLRKAIADGDNEALSEMMTNMTQRDQIRVVVLQEKANEALEMGKRLETNAQVASKELRASEAADLKLRKEESKKVYDKSVNIVLEELGKLPFLIKTGEQEQDAYVDTYLAAVRNADPSQFTPAETAQVIAQAALLPKTLGILDTLLKDIGNLEARIKRGVASTPGVAAGAGVSDPSSKGAEAPKTIASIIAETRAKLTNPGR